MEWCLTRFQRSGWARDVIRILHLHLQVKVKFWHVLCILVRLNTPGWLWKGQQCCSCCYCSSPACMHCRLLASPPLKKTPVDGRDRRRWAAIQPCCKKIKVVFFLFFLLAPVSHALPLPTRTPGNLCGVGSPPARSRQWMHQTARQHRGRWCVKHTLYMATQSQELRW